MTQQESHDPYAPPPRHRDHSGAVLRVVLVAGLLGAAVWGYTQFDDVPPLVAEAPQEQTFAESRVDASQIEPAPLGEPADAQQAPAGENPQPPAAQPPAGR